MLDKHLCSILLGNFSQVIMKRGNCIFLPSFGLTCGCCLTAAAARPAGPAGGAEGMVSVNVRTQFAEPLVPVSQDELNTASRAGNAAVSSLASLEQGMIQ